MAVYLIIVDSPNESVWDTIKTHWPAPNHYIHDDRVAAISDDKLLTADVAEKIGIGSPATGIVSQMDFYAGHTSARLVEWLNKLQ